MPGIVGLISDRTEQPLFSSMQTSMNHRNYAVDTHVVNGLHLSRLHLNYINPTRQPLHSHDGTCTLLFYGEIFSVEGETMDAGKESPVRLLELIQNRGFDVLQKINGQFCACLHDHKKSLTYLITDRYGTYPLYYTINNSRLLFATEVKALLKDNSRKQIDFHAIAELFNFGHLFGTKTMFENIQLVPAASIVRYNGAVCETSRYWTYPYSEDIYRKRSATKKEDSELQEQLGQILITAAKRQSSHADQILLSLSGGIDSRYVAALYHHIGLRNLPNFTMGPDDNEDQKYATEVANVLDFPHYKFDIKPERIWEDGRRFSYVADGMSLLSGPLQNFEPLEYFADKKKIVTYSQMCDALFGSTLNRKKVKAHKKNEAPRHVLNELLINQFNRYDKELIRKLIRPEIYRKIEGLQRIEPEKYCRNEYHPLHNYFLIFMNEYVRRGVLGGNLVINLFYQTRMLSFDNDVFNFGWHLPVVYREHQYLYRKTFGRMFPELAKIKRQGYNLKIDASNFAYELKIFEKKVAAFTMQTPLKYIVKHYKPWNRPGYVNYNVWFRKQMRENLVQYLVAREIKSGELLNAAFVKTLVNEHIEEKNDHTAILWQIINIEHFYQNFID
jgi:asparagine synthetase B (glutamine-hydrolysing)